MSAFTESLILEMLKACGMRKPERVAPKIVEVIEQEQRDEKIYELRATMTASQIAVRFHLTRQQVHNILKDFHKKGGMAA
jgi:DNA invertase Pin-like site-specific DNA recombinase